MLATMSFADLLCRGGVINGFETCLSWFSGVAGGPDPGGAAAIMAEAKVDADIP